MNFWRSRTEKDLLHKIVAEWDGWYEKEDFYAILKRERNRSNRTGLPISYVMIDLSGASVAISRFSSRESSHFFKKLITIISANTRDFDVKYLVNLQQIGILLVDTSLDGAKAFIDKISTVLYEYFEASQKEEYIKIINSIVISSYPSDQIDECATIQATPVLVKNLKFENTTDIKKLKTVYHENANFYLDWRVVSSPYGAIMMADPMLANGFSYNDIRQYYRFFKRGLDIVGAIFGLIFFLPLILFISVLIKLSSKGPVLFKQERIGQYGKPFIFLKFRSMRDGNNDEIHQQYVEKLIKGENEAANQGTDEEPIYKLQHDPRITRIGHFLRKTSLDEIPQFLNVLTGSMSLVGPRPPIPYEVENYKNWHLRRILEAKPGLTGLWQIFGRSRTTFDDMVRLDLKYVDQQSIYTDLKIIFQTIPAIVRSKSGAL